MIQTPVYLDNHATTRVDPRVVEVMLPFFTQQYGNAGSTTHALGWEAKRAVDEARECIAAAIGAQAREIVFTSGATESNNLALQGVAQRLAGKRRHIVSVVTEHPSVLDPLKRLVQSGFEVTLLPVVSAPSPEAGCIAPGQVEAALRDDTLLVSIMLANNEVGVIAPLTQIGLLCRQRGVLLHTDATQAVGKIPVDVQQLPVDLLSFSAHKLYGPKGVGALYVRRRTPHIRLQPLLEGGGQEGGLRSGTLNVAGIAGFARALQLCREEMPHESARLRQLRDRLYTGLQQRLAQVTLNGPTLDRPELRLPGNLNVSFAQVDSESLLLSVATLALSSGSACSSADPAPSHVLQALGLNPEVCRTSVRFGLGRFTTTEEIDYALDALGEGVLRLRAMGGGGVASPLV